MQNPANRVEDCEALEVCQYIFPGDMPDNIAESVRSEAKSENTRGKIKIFVSRRETRSGL